MSGKVMVQETLSTHEIEWKVMECPGPEEESSVAVQTVSHTCILRVCQQSTTRHNRTQETSLTIFDGMYASSPRKHICGDNTDVDGHRHSTDPPT